MPIGFAVLPDRSCRPLQSLDDLATLWAEPEVRVWVDLEAPTEEELRRLDEIIDLDDECLEDCLLGEQRPRVDEFEDSWW